MVFAAPSVNGGVGCGRADDDGGYGGGKSDNVTTVTGTVAMGLAVATVAKATMMTLCQCTRVKRSIKQVAAAVAAVAAVDGEDGVQWWRWGGGLDGREQCGMMSVRDGGTTRVNAATIRHDETTRGRCNERMTRGDATTWRRFKTIYRQKRPAT